MAKTLRAASNLACKRDSLGRWIAAQDALLGPNGAGTGGGRGAGMPLGRPVQDSCRGEWGCGAGRGSRGGALAGVAVEALQLVGVEAAENAGSEQALEEATNATRALPGGFDAHAGIGALGSDGEGCDEAGIEVGLGEDAAGLGLGDLVAVLAGAATGGDAEADDGAGADAALLDREVGEGGRQETVVVLAEVGDVLVHAVGGRGDRALGGDVELGHASDSFRGRGGRESRGWPGRCARPARGGRRGRTRG